MTRLLITGANGFIGRNLHARALLDPQWNVVPATRAQTGAINESTDWTSLLDGVDVVIHTANLAHSNHPANEVHRVNVLGTKNLLDQSVRAGVSRFIYISSIKAKSEEHDAYADSKAAAEQVLRSQPADRAVPYVIVRPPLVYGPGVSGNFARLSRAIASGKPVPLGAIDNRRGFIGVDNLADFLLTCAVHPNAVNQAFAVSDGRDASVGDFARAIAKAATDATGVKTRIVNMPEWMLRLAGTLTGKRDTISKLCDDLPVDITLARDLLDWNPPYSLAEGMARCFEAGREVS